MSTRAACQEARDAVAAPLSDALALARITAHRSRCADCRAYLGRIEAAAGAVRAAAGPGLDDIARARVTARLALAIDELATHNSQRQRRAAGSSFFKVAVAAGLAAAAAALLILYEHGHSGPTQAARLQAMPPPASVAAVRAPAAGPAAQGVHGAAGPNAEGVRGAAGPNAEGVRSAVGPKAEGVRSAAGPNAESIRGAAGPNAEGVRSTSGPAVAGDRGAASLIAEGIRDTAGPAAEPTAALTKGRLEVPAGAVVRASVDRYTMLTVIGPAQLVVETVAPQSSLRLESGLLLGEYEHHPGGTLRVHSPGATTTVVGTLFAVQAVGADQSRVAVRRGAVVVEGRGQSVRLRAGWSWASGEVARPEIPAALAEQLAAHAAHREPARDPALPGNRTHPLASPLVQAGAVLPDHSASPAAERSPTPQPHDPGAASVEKDAEKDPAKDTDKGAAAVEAPRPKPEAAAVTADSLYAEAEAAMRAGDRAAVRSRLTEVIRRFPRDGLADAALYELARREQADGQPAQARRYLDRLLDHDGAPELREPARYLRCRLDLDAHRDADALTCLGAFRRDFPASPHDAEVLALLIGLHQVHNDCQRALPLLDEYTRRYPSGPLDARARRTRCER